MSSLRQTWEIGKRDLVQRARSRAFLVSTLVIVALVLSIGPLLATVTEESPPTPIGVEGPVAPDFEPTLTAVAAGLDVEVRLVRFADRAEGEQALRDDDVRVLLTRDRELVWRDEPSGTITAVVSGTVQTLERTRLIVDLGLSGQEAAALLDPAPLATTTLEEPDPEREPRRIAAMAGSILLYMVILLFGQFVMLGVLEEKSNRVVEVVLSRAQPHQILAGKVIGIGLLGLGQLVVLGGAVVLMMNLIDLEGVDLAGVGLDVLIRVIFWFVLGYAFFSVIYAAMGALISRQEDAQSVGFIPVLLMLPGYFFSLVAGSDPEVLGVRITSLIPPTSPMVMPIRASVSDVPTWQIAVSVVLILASIYGLIRLAGRVYRGGILQIGAKVRIRDAWRTAKE